jgi:hypothetical protein
VVVVVLVAVAMAMAMAVSDDRWLLACGSWFVMVVLVQEVETVTGLENSSVHTGGGCPNRM